MRSENAVLVAMALCTVLMAGLAPAAEQASPESQKPTTDSSLYSGSLWDRTTLTGDWGGMRNDFAMKGVTFDASLTQAWQKVVDGGSNKSGAYGGLYSAIMNVDFQKAGLWRGAFLMVELEGRYTETSANRNTGALLPVNTMNIFPEPGEGGEQVTVPAVMFTQFLSESFGVYGGKLDTVMSGDKNDFAHGKGDDQFMNLAFNLNPVIALTVPSSTLGAGAILLPTQDPKEWVASLTAVKTVGEASTSGLEETFEGPTTLALETRLTTDFFGLTGHQLLGYTRSDKSFTSLDQSVSGIIEGLPVSQEKGSWSAYYNFDQYVYELEKGSGRGWGLFGRFGTTDGEANPIHDFASIGVGGKGIFDDRPLDRFGVGYYYVWIANQEVPRTLGFEDTKGVEAFYNIALTKWVYLTPDIQVIDPSQQNVDTAVIVGARLQMVF